MKDEVIILRDPVLVETEKEVKFKDRLDKAVVKQKKELKEKFVNVNILDESEVINLKNKS